MKNIIGASILLGIFSVLSCDNKDDAANSNPAVEEYKSVGHLIPTEMGIRWTDLYNSRNGTQNRIGFSTYNVDGALLADAAESVDDLIGMAYQYGLDEDGVLHIIVIPVNSSMRLWTPIEGRIYIDANTSTEISQQVAHEWASAYQDEHADSVWFHYFGLNVITDILETPGFETLSIIPAISDLNFTPQLLLIVNILDISGGRVSTSTPTYDASYPCPKCTVQ